MDPPIISGILDENLKVLDDGVYVRIIDVNNAIIISKRQLPVLTLIISAKKKTIQRSLDLGQKENKFIIGAGTQRGENMTIW